MAVGMAASFHVGHRAQIERPNFEPNQFQQNFQELFEKLNGLNYLVLKLLLLKQGEGLKRTKRVPL